MGRIVAPFGIQGRLRIKTYTEAPDGLAAHPRWWIRRQAGWQEVGLEDFQVRPGNTNAKLEGVDDRNAAELLRGCDVAVPRQALGEAGKDEIFWVDLEGFAVVKADGSALGKVDGFFQSGETSVMVVAGAKERLIPFIGDFVQQVDRDARRIVVAWEDL